MEQRLIRSHAWRFGEDDRQETADEAAFRTIPRHNDMAKKDDGRLQALCQHPGEAVAATKGLTMLTPRPMLTIWHIVIAYGVS